MESIRKVIASDAQNILRMCEYQSIIKGVKKAVVNVKQYQSQKKSK